MLESREIGWKSGEMTVVECEISEKTAREKGRGHGFPVIGIFERKAFHVFSGNALHPFRYALLCKRPWVNKDFRTPHTVKVCGECKRLQI